MKMNFKELKIKEVKNGSGVFSGDNHLVGYRDSKRINDGFGSLVGQKNTMKNSQNVYKHVHKENHLEETQNDEGNE